MGSSSNGGVPPGFRFHPTDEELMNKIPFACFTFRFLFGCDNLPGQ